MIGDALCGVIEGSPALPGACGQPFAQKRSWHVFCSDRCRKEVDRLKRKHKVPSDIRATLTRIEAKVDQILAGTK
jgi:hypothetical protein